MPRTRRPKSNDRLLEIVEQIDRLIADLQRVRRMMLALHTGVWTVETAAASLDCTEREVRRLITTRELHAEKRDGRWEIENDDLRDFEQRRADKRRADQR